MDVATYRKRPSGLIAMADGEASLATNWQPRPGICETHPSIPPSCASAPVAGSREKAVTEPRCPPCDDPTYTLRPSGLTTIAASNSRLAANAQRRLAGSLLMQPALPSSWTNDPAGGPARTGAGSARHVPITAATKQQTRHRARAPAQRAMTGAACSDFAMSRLVSPLSLRSASGERRDEPPRSQRRPGCGLRSGLRPSVAL